MGNNSRDLSNSNTLQTSNSSSSSLGKDRASSDPSKDSRSNLAPRKQTSENDPELLLLNSSSNLLLNRISFLSWSRPSLANRTSMRSSLTRTDSAFSLLPNNNNSNNSFSHNNSLVSFSSSNSSNLNNSFSSNSSFKHFLNPSSNLVTA